MTRNGIPIEDYPLTHSVNPGISYSIEFFGMDAATTAGLDLWKWENNGYPVEFMHRVMAFHKLSGLKEVNTQDARLIAEERAMKRNKGKKR